MYGFKILFPIWISLAFVYIEASGPNTKFTFFKPVKCCNPFIGFVYLTPDVSTYIPNSDALPIFVGIFILLKFKVVPPTVTWVGLGEAIFVSTGVGVIVLPSLTVVTPTPLGGTTILIPLTPFPVLFCTPNFFCCESVPLTLIVPPLSS